MLVTLEGGDGSGKSTLAARLAVLLARHRPLVLREPGSTEVGESIRDLLLHRHVELGGEAEMHLFMAARSELIRREIRPALQEGRLVIADRYHDSTMVYQGLRGAPVYWPPTFPIPDLTVLLDLDPNQAEARRREAGRLPDRLEAQSADFHSRVAAEYRRRAAADQGRWLVLPASEPVDRLVEAAGGRIESMLAAHKR